MTLRGVRALASARVVLLSVLFAATLSQEVSAQARPAAPTGDQLEVFRNLPPDQQRAVLDAMSGASGGSTRQKSQAPLSSPAVGTPVDDLLVSEEEPGPPRIDGPVTLVLDVDLKKVEPEESGGPGTRRPRSDSHADESTRSHSRQQSLCAG